MKGGVTPPETLHLVVIVPGSHRKKDAERPASTFPRRAWERGGCVLSELCRTTTQSVGTRWLYLWKCAERRLRVIDNSPFFESGANHQAMRVAIKLHFFGRDHYDVSRLAFASYFTVNRHCDPMLVELTPLMTRKS